MEIKLTFLITFVSGEQKAQEISIPADPRHPFETQAKALMQTMLSQYATIGYVMHPVRDNETGEILPNRYRLILPSQIGSVECDLPTILIASEHEIPKVTLD